MANLTNRTVERLRPREKGYSVWDKGRIGLHVFVSPHGSKHWRLRYYINKIPRVISIGDYRYFSVAEARSEAVRLRRSIARGIDPLEEKRALREAKQAETNTFSKVSHEWFGKVSDKWSPPYRNEVLRRLEKDLYPSLGSRSIAEIKPIELLKIIRRIEERCVGVAHRVLQTAGSVFRFAVASGLCEHDPSVSLKGALASPNRGHFAAITRPSEVGELLRAIDDYQGSFVVKCALRFLPFVFVRPGELRSMEWSEVDFDALEWRIPAARMKMRDPHIVSLSRQALSVLEEVKTVTGDSQYVFLSEQRYRGFRNPISENALNNAIRRIGYSKDQMCAHGFRAMASSLLNELGHRPDLIELQLAHKERGVRAVYHRSEHLEARREMMQQWADYLDSLRENVKVIAIRKTG